MTFTLTSDAIPRPRFTRSTGAAAQKAGKTLEEWIDFSACLPDARKIVSLEQLPRLGARFVGKGKFINTRVCIDFIGVLQPGVPFFFDAKSCGKEAVSFDAGRWHKETPHQSAFLRKMRKAGAVAGILVRASHVNRYLWADISDVDVLENVRFARDGVPCKEWLACGTLEEPIDFAVIASEYKLEPVQGEAAR